MTTLAERLTRTLANLEQAVDSAHRASNSVKLLAVSKTKPVSDIVLAYEAGQRLFGENYVQEGVQKIQALQDLSDIQWHFIGPIQSNKTRLIAAHFAWVQSLDREKIAQRLNDQRSAYEPLNVCIQVNICDDPAKAGVQPEQVPEFAAFVQGLPNLTLRGLMTIPAADLTEQQSLVAFRRMHELFDSLGQDHPQCDTLSMGMSGDMAQAIQAGATLVRLGTAIFGPRQP